MAKKKKGFLSGLILSAKKTAKNSKRDNDDKKQTKNVQAKQKTSKQTQKVVKQQTQKATGTANTNTVKKSAQKAYSASVQAQKDFANKTVKTQKTYTGNKLERQNTVKAAGKAYDTYASQQRQKAKVNIEKEIGRQLTADEENKVFGDYDKSVSEGRTKYLNNTRKAYNNQNTVKYKTGITLNSDEANKMQTYAMQGKVQDYAFSKDKNGKPTKLAKKLAQQNLGNMLEGGAKTASTAVLDRLANSQDATTTMTKKGLYSEKQQKAIQQAKDSKAYKVGTFVGEGLNFVAPGAAGASLAKNAGKTVVKGLVKDAAKNGVKDTLKVSGKDAVKAVGKDVAYDSLASLPLNVQSAVKDSTGTDGKINTKAFAASLGLNVAGDVVLGGAVSGAGKAITAKSVSRYAKLVEKANTKGVNALSTDELKTFEKLNTKFAGKTIDKNTIDSGAINKAKELDSNGTAGKVSAMNELNKTTLSKKEANSFIKLLGREKAGVLSDTEKVQLDNLKKKTAELNTSANKLEATKQADTGINPDVVMGNSNAAETAVKTENIGPEAQVKNAEPTQKIDNAEIAEAPKAEVPTGKADTVNAAEVSTDSLHKKSQDFARELAGQRGKARKETTTFIRENVKNLADTIKYGNDLDAEMSADAIAKDIVANTKYTVRDTEDDMLADAIGSLRNKWIRIPSNDIPADFKEFAASAKKLGLNLTANQTKGKPIDEVFEELKEIAPHWFSDERMGGSEYYHESPLDQIVNAFANKPQSREMSIIDYIEEEVSNFGGTADDVADMIAKEESRVRDRLIKIATEEAQRVDTKVAKIKKDNPTPEDVLKIAKDKKVSTSELNDFMQTYTKVKGFSDADIKEIFSSVEPTGIFAKTKIKSQAKAIEDVDAHFNKSGLGAVYDTFIHSISYKNEHEFMAYSKKLIEELSKTAGTDENAAAMLVKVMEKTADATSQGGRIINAAKMLYKNTTAGRVRIALRDIDAINKKFADRLKGKEIELTPEQVQKIIDVEGKSEKEVLDVMDEISKEIYDQLPATWFEKWNEWRHFSMLANPKTHARNLLGNGVFAIARRMSESLEVAAYKLPAVKKRIASYNGKAEMLYVKPSEIKQNKDYLNTIFDENYSKSGSQNKFKEGIIHNGSTSIKNKVGKFLVNANYAALEAEDMIVFKPAYRKAYTRWCKSRDIDLTKLAEMTDMQKVEANKYAMAQAEHATFRDASVVSDAITKLKTSTAGKKGKTPVGTAAYRLANATLESTLPFVKTPVNIFSRAIDYSPYSIIKSVVELTNAKDVDMFKLGIHHLCTGLTGTGVTALGIYLAENDLITVKAGDESGDEYYDRELGYQDYSAKINIGGKEYSLTLDWLSPNQVSLFMGAALHDNLSKDGFQPEDMLQTLSATVGPIMDMSFMSGPKDTIETIGEEVFNSGSEEDTNWSGAVVQTLLGHVPQNYLSSFVPQLSSQLATATDKYQRDTRSTKEDDVSASWDSWGKKIINRIPGLREYVLHPKVDRKGKDVENFGDNIVTRLISAFVNPATVKEINLTDTDKELIKIYNSLPTDTKSQKQDKKYFFYNFTGHPSYDLANGKRMTYKELYTYGKSSRADQWKSIEDMTKSKSYKNMTETMKADEVSGYYWIAQTAADAKTYGSKYAMDRIIDDKKSYDGKYLKQARAEGVSNDALVKYYVGKEKLLARAHETYDETKAMAAAIYGNSAIAKVYGIKKEDLILAKKYIKNKGVLNGYKTFTDAMCNVMSNIDKAEVNASVARKAVAAANYKIDNDTLKVMGFSEDVSNMGYGLRKKFDYTLKQLNAMENDAKFNFDADNNGYLNKADIVSYIDSLGIDNQIEKACLFRYFDSTANNPYGSIPNWLNNSGSEKSGSGYGRHGYGGWGHGGGGGGGSSFGKSWETYYGELVKVSKAKNAAVKAKDNTSKSALTEAYRKREQKRLEKLRKN